MEKSPHEAAGSVRDLNASAQGKRCSSADGLENYPRRKQPKITESTAVKDGITKDQRSNASRC